jgi:ubiquinone/menaquinone biosynthesis C-methylase UbiE
MKHNEEIVDQFTRQAQKFAASRAARNEPILELILHMARPERGDTALDVACGPGLLACALAKTMHHVTGIDLTPAMLDKARQTQREQGIGNVTWDQGDVTALPYPGASFDIVTCRFSFHHFANPASVLREMRRVCRPGGRIVAADIAPATAKAEAFNAMERLRDPSHTRAMPREELAGLFQEAGLPKPEVEEVRLALDLDGLLARSYPREGDEARIRDTYERALEDDFLDLEPRREQGKIVFSLPIAILGAQVPHG